MHTDSQSVVTFVFPGPGGQSTGICPVPWRGQGIPIRLYFREPPLHEFKLVSFMLGRGHGRGKAYNRKGEQVRLNYVPCENDVLVLK